MYEHEGSTIFQVFQWQETLCMIIVNEFALDKTHLDVCFGWP